MGAVIGGTELLLRVIDYLSSSKTGVLGNPKKGKRHSKKTKTNREKTERARA
jgi:hypothetical protein